jgi:hypothetical protein
VIVISTGYQPPQPPPVAKARTIPQVLPRCGRGVHQPCQRKGGRG